MEETRDPYIIWISEIILQQTRVVQGLEYFLRFTERFPDVASLAVAEEDEVLKYWQGLGYYSRARNLHAAAKSIMERFNGIDLDAARRVAGNGFYYLMGDIARLHSAVISYARDFMINRGFTYCVPPFMIRSNVVTRCNDAFRKWKI